MYSLKVEVCFFLFFVLMFIEFKGIDFFLRELFGRLFFKGIFIYSDLLIINVWSIEILKSVMFFVSY